MDDFDTCYRAGDPLVPETKRGKLRTNEEHRSLQSFLCILSISFKPKALGKNNFAREANCAFQLRFIFPRPCLPGRVLMKRYYEEMIFSAVKYENLVARTTSDEFKLSVHSNPSRREGTLNSL